MDSSPPGFSVHEILHTRILEWGSISFSKGSSQPRDWTRFSYIVRGILYHWATGEAYRCIEMKWSEVAQSCPTLYNPMACSLPGSYVHGIFQPRTLEWVAISLEIALNLQIALVSMAILTILILPIQGHGMAFHFFESSSVSFIM